jgi:hypothetical protein
MAVEYVVVLNGLPESGRNAFASCVAERFRGKVVMHSTMDTVRLMALEWFGVGVEFEGEKGINERKRRLWCDLNDAWARYCNGPVEELAGFVNQINNRNGAGPVLLIVQAGSPVEINKIRGVFGKSCVTVLVKKEGELVIQSNHADRNLSNYTYDVTICNDGDRDQLVRMAERFLDLLELDVGRIVNCKKTGASAEALTPALSQREKEKRQEGIRGKGQGGD